MELHLTTQAQIAITTLPVEHWDWMACAARLPKVLP